MAADLTQGQWRRLVELAHHDKAQAYALYTAHYQKTDGQAYARDAHQMATYLKHYHTEVDDKDDAGGREIITELYVPRAALGQFMRGAARMLKETHGNVIYGTVRLIEAEDASALAWATQPWACIVLNLHTGPSEASQAAVRHQFRSLIDLSLEQGGSYYLTYHAYASESQVRKAYPVIDSFIDAKDRLDPEGVFESNWFRDLREMLGR